MSQGAGAVWGSIQFRPHHFSVPVQKGHAVSRGNAVANSSLEATRSECNWEVNLRTACKEGTLRYLNAIADAAGLELRLKTDPIVPAPKKPVPEIPIMVRSLTPPEFKTITELLAQPQPSMYQIAETVAFCRGITVGEMIGQTVDKTLHKARNEAFTICRKHGGYTLGMIGKFFGRDHTTVRYGICKHLGIPYRNENGNSQI